MGEGGREVVAGQVEWSLPDEIEIGVWMGGQVGCPLLLRM